MKVHGSAPGCCPSLHAPNGVSPEHYGATPSASDLEARGTPLVERLQWRSQGFVAGFSERREKEHGSVGGALLDGPFVLVKVNRLSTLPTNGFAAPPHMLQQQRVQQPSHPIGKVPAKFGGIRSMPGALAPLVADSTH